MTKIQFYLAGLFSLLITPVWLLLAVPFLMLKNK